MLNHGVLGINARNLSYIKKFNWKKEIRLANDKLATKKFLSERWIPFAKTYEVIKDRKQLFDIDFSKLPAKDFQEQKKHTWKSSGFVARKIFTDAGKNVDRNQKKKTLRFKIFSRR